jgi:ATP-dependent RNA helicase DHX57
MPSTGFGLDFFSFFQTSLRACLQFCNNIQLNRVLPPGPREYWNELAVEHKKSGENEQWMYHQDPFKAQKQLQERQNGAVAKKAKEREPNKEPKVAKEFINAPEVKMGSQLRGLVEDVIKKV